MSTSCEIQSNSDRTLRHWVCTLLIIAACAIQAVRLVSVTALYNPGKPWPRSRPPHTPLLSANDRSRWCTVWSLVERRTFQIDEIIRVPGWNTIDKVQKDGHFYSSKPPLLPVCAAGLYWCLKHICGMNLLQQTHGTVQSILLLINLIPFLLSLIVLARILDKRSQCDMTRIYILTCAAFGTFLSTFLITFNNHTIAANAVLWALASALPILIDRDIRSRWFVISGFCAAFAVASEFPAAIFLAGLGVLLLKDFPRKTLLFFVPSALVPITAHFALNIIATGGWKPFYAGFGTDLYNFAGSYWTNPVGIDKNLDSPLAYLFNCTIGHHGIWSLSPIFLVTVYGWATFRQHTEKSRRNLDLLSLVCTLVIISFYMTRTEQYNYGGLTSGLRWAFWLIPLWLWSMIPALDRGLKFRSIRILCGAVLLISIFSATFPWQNPWTHPWLFQILEQAGWIRYQ